MQSGDQRCVAPKDATTDAVVTVAINSQFSKLARIFICGTRFVHITRGCAQLTGLPLSFGVARALPNLASNGSFASRADALAGSISLNRNTINRKKQERILHRNGPDHSVGSFSATFSKRSVFMISYNLIGLVPKLWKPMPLKLNHKQSQFPRRCTRCHGTGRMPCESCNGRGEVYLGQRSRGAGDYGRCQGCAGLKVARCRSCGGSGNLHN